MKTEELKKVEITIMEDDRYFNNLLAEKLKRLELKEDIRSRYNFKIRQYYKAGEYLNSLDNINEDHDYSIAFIDFYLGDGVNGEHLINLLVERDERLEIVLMSRSPRTIDRMLTRPSGNKIYTKLVKNQYTPDVCSIIVENYLNTI